MIYKIIDRITTYSASVSQPVTVVEFGTGTPPAVPYVVVREEQNINGIGIRINAHFKPGQQKFLRSYMRTTIGNALNDFKALSSDGNYNRLQSDITTGLGTIVTNNDDGTISLDRLYYMGDILY